MTRKTARVFLEIAAGVIVGAALIVGVGIYRLSQGPISLAFMNSTINAALNPERSDVVVSVGDTTLEWDGWSHPVSIVANDIRISQKGDAPSAVLPQAAITLSVRAALSGVLAPSSIEIRSPSLKLVRFADGRFSFGFSGTKQGDVQSTEGMVPSLVMDELMAPPSGGRTFGYLRRVAITSATLIFDDRKSGKVWLSPSASLQVSRDAEGLKGGLSATVHVKDQETVIEGTIDHAHEDDTTMVRLKVNDLPLGVIADTFPEVAGYLVLGPTVNGTVSVRVSREGLVRSVGYTVAGSYGKISGTVNVAKDAASVVGSLMFEDLIPDRMADAVPSLASLKGIDIPLTGKATFTGYPEGGVESVSVDVTGGAGTITNAALGPDPIPVMGLRGKGSFATDMSAVIESLKVDLVNGTLNVTADAGPTPDGRIKLSTHAELTDFPLDLLDTYWPKPLAVDAREWVVPNINTGMADKATIDVDLLVSHDGNGIGDVALDRLSGQIDFHDADVDYLAPLPKAHGVAGKAVYGGDWMTIDTTGGTVKGLALPSAHIELTKIGTDDLADIRLNVDGPLRDALEVLDHKPYRFVSKLDLDPAAVSGDASASVRFRFPMIKDLSGDDVKFAADAALNGSALNPGPFGLGVKDGNFKLSITNPGMNVTGSAELDGTPVDVSWSESFDASKPEQSRFQVEGKAGADRIASLIPKDYLKVDGETGLRVDYSTYRDGHGTLKVKADTSAAAMVVPPLNWAKPAGKPFKLDVEANLRPDGSIDLPVIQGSGAGAELSASARITKDGPAGEGSTNGPQKPADDKNTKAVSDEKADGYRLKTLSLSNLKYADNQMTGVVSLMPDGGYSLNLNGQKVDVSWLIDSEDEPIGPQPLEPPKIGPKLSVDARAAILTAGPYRRMEDASVKASYDGKDVTALNLSASIGNGSALDLSYGPDGTTGQTVLSVRSDNAGRALEALDWSRRIQGGSLKVDGRRPRPDGPMEGTVTIEDFTLLEAPAMAKLLEFVSLTGVLSSLSESGLSFTKMEGKFSFLDGLLRFDDVKAYGSSIGITAKGYLDSRHSVISAKGTIIPAYTFNKLLGSIPLIGTLFSGGEEGIFAADYSLDGPVEDPEVSVNPLSALAPGFLKRLFGQNGEDKPSEVLDVGPGKEGAQGNLEGSGMEQPGAGTAGTAGGSAVNPDADAAKGAAPDSTVKPPEDASSPSGQ